MKPTLLVLAAGMGSRYGGLKQMDPMGPNGETVLDYSIYDAIRAGFSRVIFIIRKDFSETFKTQVGDKFSDKIEIQYVYQDLNDLPSGHLPPEGRVKPWGTTHAILAARHIIDSPFAVINADDFYGSDSFKQITSYFTQAHNIPDSTDHYCMVGYTLSNTLSDHGEVNRGICYDSNGLLKDVEEHTEIRLEIDNICKGNDLQGNRIEIDPTSTVSMNFWGFPQSIIKDFETHFEQFLQDHGSEMKSECYIPTVVNQMLKSGKANCSILKTTSPWFGVTYPQDKEAVVNSIQNLIQEKEYPAKLWG